MLPGVKLAEHSGSDKSCVFTTRDFSDESSGKQELFCLRFASVDKLKAFWAAWEGAQAANEALGVGKEPAAGGGDKAAEAEPTATAAATAGGAGQPRAGGAASDATAETGAAVSKPGGGAAEEEGEEGAQSGVEKGGE